MSDKTQYLCVIGERRYVSCPDFVIEQVPEILTPWESDKYDSYKAMRLAQFEEWDIKCMNHPAVSLDLNLAVTDLIGL